MTKFLTGQCHLKGPLLKAGLVDSPRCNMQTGIWNSLTFFCDCEALVVLWFRHLGCHCLKSGEVANISISKILRFVESEGLLNAYATDSTKNKKQPRWKVYCHAHLMYSFLLYSTVLHSARLCSALLYCRLLNFTVLNSTLLHCTLLCCTLLCSTLPYNTLLSSPLLFYTLLYILQHQVTDIQSSSYVLIVCF